MRCHDEESDSQIAAEIAKAQRGDHAAFEALVHHFAPRVFRVASRFLPTERVEELAQEVFLTAYQQLRDYRGQGSFESWLSRITVTRCLNALRAQRRRPEITAASLSGEEFDVLERLAAAFSTQRFDREEQRHVARDLAAKLLATLEPEERMVLQLLDGEDTPVKEIAALLGWSESKVKVQAFRSRRKLREALETLLQQEKVRRQ
ncbi:MAG: sigma-70 family RNA polymerase sigma factor [Acidobacteria bacterium]|nr:sigma-70 family RNA polymerase sigma factor [Acidobacteriota bacterium]